MSWVAHDLEPYILQRKLGPAFAISFLAVLIGSWGPDMFTKWFVHGLDFAGLHFQASDPVQFHRGWPGSGFTHSLAFALALAFVVVFLFFRDAPNKKVLVLFFFLATASHGALDAMTDGGLGVAFFAPFRGARYFFTFRPIVVSPIGVGSFFSAWGLAVVESELLWVWLPASLVVALVLILRLWAREKFGR